MKVIIENQSRHISLTTWKWTTENMITLLFIRIRYSYTIKGCCFLWTFRSSRTSIRPWYRKWKIHEGLRSLLINYRFITSKGVEPLTLSNCGILVLQLKYIHFYYSYKVIHIFPIRYSWYRIHTALSQFSMILGYGATYFGK